MPDIETAQLVDRLMRRIHARVGAKASDFDTHKLGPAGGILLLTLADLAPVKLHVLVDAMQRDKSQITRAIQALEAKELITRHADPDDARVTVLDVSKEGEAAVIAIQQAVAEALGEVLSPLSPQEQGTLRGLLRQLG